MNDIDQKSETEKSEKGKIPEKVSFDFIKGNQYREILITGIHGGLTPNGFIQMSVFTERQAIPKQTVHEVSPDGAIGKEIIDERLTRGSIIRSVEATLYMDIKTAEVAIKWLQANLDKAKQLFQEIHKSENK